MRKKITEIKFDMVSDIDLGFFIKNMRLVHVKVKILIIIIRISRLVHTIDTLDIY
jgi:hypothetical protein